MSSIKVKFDIATNFDKEIVDEAAKHECVEWIYGKMNNDVVGGGRPSITLPKLSWDELKEYVDYCHKNNKKFNYLLNSICLGNKEVHKPFHKDLLKLLYKLEEVGVDGVTIGSPFLCQLIKKQFPNWFVSNSVYNKITSLMQIKYWVSIGVNEVTLFHTMNRDFKGLKTILKYLKDKNVRVRLVANNSCIHECPFSINHGAAHAHNSKSYEESHLFGIDYCSLNCNTYKIENPTKIVASEWIRPEDIKYYEEICEEVGNYNLVLKLTERGKTTKWLKNTLNAYMNRSYEGNLLDILNYPSNKENQQMYSDPVVNMAMKWEYNIEKLSKFKDSVFYKYPYVENKKLDGFLDKFKNEFKCIDNICDDEGWGEDNKKEKLACSYCKKWAEKAINVDEESRTKIVKNAKETLDDFHSSKMFFIEDKPIKEMI